MASRKVKTNVLGRGISALISETAPAEAPVRESDAPEDAARTVQYIDINDIKPNRNQPRKKFDPQSISELAASIQEHGIIQPLIVCKADQGYELVAGERRWRAAREAALDKVPCLVREFSKEENALIAIIENMQREDLDPIEEAEGLETMMKEYGLTQEEVSRSVGKSRPYITNSLRLLKLDKKVQEMLIDGRLSIGHARPLLALTDGELQRETAQLIYDRKMSVRDTEKLVKKLLSVDPADYATPSEMDRVASIYREIEENLKNVLGTKAKINAKDKSKGRIEIEYSSQDELDRIVNMLYNAR